MACVCECGKVCDCDEELCTECFIEYCGAKVADKTEP